LKMDKKNNKLPKLNIKQAVTVLYQGLVPPTSSCTIHLTFSTKYCHHEGYVNDQGQAKNKTVLLFGTMGNK